MSREEIKRNILRIIDEISPFENIDVIWDTLLEETINECVKQMFLNFPTHLLPTKPLDVNTFYNTDDGWGTIDIPEDFIRLSFFKFNSWRRPVFVPLTQDDPRYFQQKNKYARAGVAKPVCALCGDYYTDYGYMQTVLELYPVYYDWTKDDIEKALYVGVMLPEELPSHLLDPYFWLASSQVLITMEKTDFAQVCQTKYQQYVTSLTPNPNPIH